MKHLALIALTFSLASSAWASCNTFVIEDREACYEPLSRLQVTIDQIKDRQVDLGITPLLVKFREVPSPGTYDFLNIDYDEEKNATKIQVMSFACSGELPLDADVFSESLASLAESKDEASSGTNIFIATGQAGETITVDQDKKARSKGFDRFLELYESKSGNNELMEDVGENIYIPEILAGRALPQSTEGDLKLYARFFSRTNSSINGCSKRFLSVMQDHLFENVIKHSPFKGIKVRKKAGPHKFQISWLF